MADTKPDGDMGQTLADTAVWSRLSIPERRMVRDACRAAGIPMRPGLHGELEPSAGWTAHPRMVAIVLAVVQRFVDAVAVRESDTAKLRRAALEFDIPFETLRDRFRPVRPRNRVGIPPRAA
jgi:hypothetical protein